MNLWKEFCQEALAEDGTWDVFVVHKLWHVFAGCIVGLLLMHATDSFTVGYLGALIVGILREMMKQTPILLHVVTALITASGAFIALWLTGQNGNIQIVSVIAMVIYMVVVMGLQTSGIYPKSGT